MDIQNAVENAMTNLVASGKIEQLIEKKLEETVKELIDGALRSYSDFGKELKAKIEASLRIDMKAFSLPEYNTVIGNHVISIVENTMYPMAKAAIEENLKKFFKPLEKDSYTFTEVVELFKKSAVEWEGAEPGENFTARVDERSNSFTYLSIDMRQNQERYRCKYRIGIHDGKIFSLTVDGDNATGAKNPNYHGFGDTLFKMYASGVTLIDDKADLDSIAYFGEDD